MRRKIAADALHGLLTQAYENIQTSKCPSCSVPWPTPAERGGTGANWRIELPPKCVNGCENTIVQAAAKVWTQYDLRASNQRAAPANQEKI